MPARTILVLEDDPALRDVVVEILQDARYNVLQAAGRQEALQVAASGRVDVIVCDIGMPGISGADITTEIKALHPRAGILYISGNIEGQLGESAARAEGARFLRKPFRQDALLQEIEKLAGDGGA